MKKDLSILEKRFQKKDKTKMKSLAERSADGSLSVFSGVFQAKKLNGMESAELLSILYKYSDHNDEDQMEILDRLSIITSEIKVINHQAILLHGYRIKQAQQILRNYKEGAFSSWLMFSYGNRQTPYNFLVYFELYEALSPKLQIEIEKMPRQAIYSLATRKGSFEKKELIIKNYQGESKERLLAIIRTEFPISETDSRKHCPGIQANKLLAKAVEILTKSGINLSLKEFDDFSSLLKKLENAKKDISNHLLPK